MCQDWEKRANYTKLEEEGELLIMSYVELKQAKKEEVWFLVFDCNNHIKANHKTRQ